MSLSVGIVGLLNVGPSTTLTCSQILRVCVARASMRDLSCFIIEGGLINES